MPARPTLAGTVDEESRLLALHHYAVLDTAPDPALDDLVQLAAQVLGTPLAAMAFVDRARVWPKAVVGMPAADMRRAGSCWELAVSHDSPLIALDTQVDVRTAGTRTEVDGRLVRFFAGAPIRTLDGLGLGVLAVMDFEPRSDAPGQIDAIEILARQATAQLELGRQVRDATDRGNALDEVSQRLLRLIQTTHAATMVEGEDRRIVLANDEMCRLFGIEAPAATLVGIDCGAAYDGVARLFHDPPAFLQGIQQLIASRAARVGERLEMADGRTLERDYVPIIVGDTYRGHLWQYRDITTRLRTEAELAASQGRTRAVVEHMLEALVLVDAETGCIRSINPAASRMFACAPDEIAGHHIRTLLPDEPPYNEPDFLARAYEMAIGRTTEWRARRSTGEVFPAELQLFEFETGEGLVFAGSIRDLSDRQEVDRLKKQFVSMVSHELRTPLTSIGGSLSMLESGTLGTLTPEGTEVLEIAQRSITRLVSLVNDLLDLGRLDAGRMDVVPAPTPAADLVQRALESVRMLAERQGVHLDVPDSGVLLVAADTDRIVQVLVNLVSNAVKFSPRGAVVTVRWTVEAGDVRFSVIDEGRGVPLALQQVIFEPFRQVERADARAKGGSGLGLAISRALVQQHGGRIGVSSREGAGATFWFTLPLAA